MCVLNACHDASARDKVIICLGNTLFSQSQSCDSWTLNNVSEQMED